MLQAAGSTSRLWAAAWYGHAAADAWLCVLAGCSKAARCRYVQRSRAQWMMLRAHHMPCRQNDDGTLTRESNARYVQWSDGTESIMLGDEVLTLDRQKQPRANTYVHVVRYDAIQVGAWVCWCWL